MRLFDQTGTCSLMQCTDSHISQSMMGSLTAQHCDDSYYFYKGCLSYNSFFVFFWHIHITFNGYTFTWLYRWHCLLMLLIVWTIQNGKWRPQLDFKSTLFCDLFLKSYVAVILGGVWNKLSFHFKHICVSGNVSWFELRYAVYKYVSGYICSRMFFIPFSLFYLSVL